ncbi:hypothetical protein FKM82_021912 [Ascaphus truei]
MPSSDARKTRGVRLPSPLCELSQGEEPLAIMQDLELRLRIQMDDMERLRLSVAEALGSSTGFSYMQQNSAELKVALAEHMTSVRNLNERMESLQISTMLFLQMNTKLRMCVTQRSSRRNQYSMQPQFCDDTQSGLGWNPVRPRRNSDAASEMSCAW